MTKLILYPAVYLGMASFPILFFAGHYLLQKKFLTGSAPARKRWLAALSYSVLVFAAWWAVYFFGDLVPMGPTVNSLATVSQIFGYSAYALLPAAAISALVSLVGALVTEAA